MVGAARWATPRAATPRDRAGGWLTWLGILVIACFAAGLRLAWLDAALPGFAGPDERVMVARTQMLLSGRSLNAYDWPSGSFLLLGGAIRALSPAWPALAVPDGAARYVLARGIAAAAGVALVVVSARLASRLCRSPAQSRVAAWTAASTLAVAFTAVVMSRTAHPEGLQDTFVALALLAALRLQERADLFSAGSAGAFSGLAAGTKYVGGVVLLVVLAAALWAPLPWRRRLLAAAVACGAATAAFVAAVPDIAVRPSAVLAGVSEQVLHSAGGHLGFDAPSGALGYHLTQTLPGSIGWPLTVISLLALVLALARGTRARRLVAWYVIAAAVIVGGSHLTFPRYILLVLPGLVCLAAAVLADLAVSTAGRRLIAVAVTLVLVPPALDAARIVHAASDVQTRALATGIVARLPGPVLAEPYSVAAAVAAALPRNVRHVPNFGQHPALTRCTCYLVTSSSITDRFRREPERYAAEVAVYDGVRRRGLVVSVVSPSTPLDYRWDALPQYGVRAVPLGRRVVVGPVVTIYRMR